jgi:hypothetical protein
MPNVGSTPNRHRFDFQIAATRKLPKPTAQQSVAVEAASVSRTALSQINITVDAIMFANGDMFAADSSYADEIVARVMAAKELVAHVRAGQARGQQRSEILVDLSGAASSRAGEQGAWLRDFTATFSRQPDKASEAYISSLERLTVPKIAMISPEPGTKFVPIQ